MEFNQAIPLREKQKFAEGSALASTRDDRNNSFLWKKGVQHSEQMQEVVQGLQRVSREVAKSKRRIVGGFVPQKPATVTPFPFYIYNINNATDATKNAQTFQIRDGLVGFRPQYVYPGTTIDGILNLVSNGNYEVALSATGTDGVNDIDSSPIGNISYNEYGEVDFSQAVAPNRGGSVTISQVDGSPAPVLIRSNNLSAGTGFPPLVQIVVQNVPGQSFTVGFYIKIVDDPAGPYTELWASTFDPGRSPSGVFNFVSTMPNPDQTFCIGAVTVGFGNATGYLISQAQVGHLLNRYLETSPNPTGNVSNGKFYGLPQVHRGFWASNNLSGKIFYPGDQVIDETVLFPVTGLGNVAKVWTYVGTSGLGGIKIETSPPSSNPSRWLVTGLAVH